MADKRLKMNATQIAEIMGTVGSPLIVIAELIKNAVDASAKKIQISYNLEEKTIVVENDYKGFSTEEIEALFLPGISNKKTGGNLENEHGMYLTGSKGLGLLSVFLLCDVAEIFTAPKDEKIYKIVMNKKKGTISENTINEKFERHFTKVVLKDIDSETIGFLSSETEVRKLRHICTCLYKNKKIPFPQMILNISGHDPQEINYTGSIPPMSYDVDFNYDKAEGKLRFQCDSHNKSINNKKITFSNFSLGSVQKLMLKHYNIKETILTRTNDIPYTDFSKVPSFEGRILVYERSNAKSMKTYGPGVNIYINDFALYNYLAEENDWLDLADFSQRRKATCLKPHNVFGYVNFPLFNENLEELRVSNERADFIQDMTFVKLMYLLKGVVMFILFNIDVAERNPERKEKRFEGTNNSGQKDSTSVEDGGRPDSNSGTYESQGEDFEEGSGKEKKGAYSPESSYKPRKDVRTHLEFTREEGRIVDRIKGHSNLSNKIYNLVFELSKLDSQVHRYSIAYLYRALLESSTRYFSQSRKGIVFDENNLEHSVLNVLNYLNDKRKKGELPSSKTIKTWRSTIKDRKLIDTLNEYIHKDNPVDAHLLQETWNTMSGYVITCLNDS